MEAEGAGLVAFCDIPTSGQETEWVYSYNPEAHTGRLNGKDALGSAVLCL